MSAGGNDDLCSEYLTHLPISGAAISIFVGTGNETRISATDARAVALDEAQFSVGEGPRWDAVRTRRPVLVPDTRATHLKWPALGMSLADTGAAALFALPLTVGAVDVGVVELHRTVPGELNELMLVQAQLLAGRTSWTLMRMILEQHRHAPDEDAPGPDPLDRREIHQATGMILVQADVSAADALLLLRARAFAHGQSLQEAAEAVIGRKLSFAPDPAPDPDVVSEQTGGEH
ncbi:GAF domain-containing protein [Arthrobacter sp. MDT2-16]